ncbi:hypothetical protein [Mycobacterium paraseoulense]|uniref:Alanine and proline rich protein n=1 Tax=Mycobacterium paraseoulense TaxID=590652 RepID=A0A1X0I557_9MYCO|nr:hypothetical protein [Mycobacterium paraseoulense]MCV7394730.1 hypothetical protein [Mycobacterium paraseoulense]ORB33992.1 hypothetical protein BST39_25075 [Mycobacterium paraseoulense]BBZ73659.1 hypothetical protein MPRS_47520 [Mycobacterium paraseoulense]
MAERLDVAGRLAEGLPAVEHTQSYVQACHAVGYQHPDLTAHPAQARDWYGTEDGLDLRALDRDCAELRAAGEAITEALRMQRAQGAELAAAWTGPAADAAVRFLERHCDAAGAVATELRAAAQRCESLRDNLWYLVDAKVATTIAIDDGSQAQRPAWLAAAAVVRTGVGDRHAAEEVIREQVVPYVDNEIRNDWLTTMRSTRDGVRTSYDMVTDRMATAPTARFEAPGDLGPGYQPLRAAPPSTPPVAVTPAAAMTASPPSDPAPTATTLAPAPVPAAPQPDWGTALSDAGMPAGDLGGGLGGAGLGGGGAGLLGLAGRIIDAVGGLLGSGDESGAADPFGEHDAFDEDPFTPDDTDHDEPAGTDHTEDAEDTEGGTTDAAAQPLDAPAPVGEPAPVGAPKPGDPPPPTVDAPVNGPPPIGPPTAGAPVPPVTDGKTPCEIAADQLPQAGR